MTVGQNVAFAFPAPVRKVDEGPLKRHRNSIPFVEFIRISMCQKLVVYRKSLFLDHKLDFMATVCLKKTGQIIVV